MKKLINIVIGICALLCFIASADTDIINDWTRNDLKGKIKSYVYTEIIEESDGKATKYVHKDLFDNKGNWLERQIYRNGNTVQDKLILTYDATKNSHNVNHYNEKGELLLKETFSYDDKGNWLEDSGYYVKDGSFGYRNTYTYTESKSLMINTVYDEQGNVYYRITNRNDENGNPIEEYIYNGNDSKPFIKKVIKYISYDTYGNWTERHHLPTEDTATKRIIKRQFTYYQ